MLFNSVNLINNKVLLKSVQLMRPAFTQKRKKKKKNKNHNEAFWNQQTQK